MDDEKLECQHDINISPNSILLDSREFLVYPPRKAGVCVICGQSFCFELVNEKYIQKEGENIGE